MKVAREDLHVREVGEEKEVELIKGIHTKEGEMMIGIEGIVEIMIMEDQGGIKNTGHHGEKIVEKKDLHNKIIILEFF